MSIKSKFLTVALLLGSTACWASSYKIEPDYSNIEFRIRHLVSMAEGHFSQFEGWIDFDAAKPELSKVDVTIDPGSVYTRNKQRDKHLRGKDFFDVGTFPKAHYVSDGVKVLGADRYELDGVLTMHGHSQRVPLTVTLRGSTTDPIGRSRLGFAAEGKLSRKDFGITWNETLDNGGMLLGDEVEISIEMDAVETRQSARR